jgi:hypothetical protein
MYEFRDETIRALTPRIAKPTTEATALEAWVFKHLAVSRSAGVTHVKFKEAETVGEEAVSNFGSDFAQLADRLGRDSKVLLDFAGVKEFSAASIDVLVQFKQKLQTKGSRLALCCLDPAVRESFFAVSSPQTHSIE